MRTAQQYAAIEHRARLGVIAAVLRLLPTSSPADQSLYLTANTEMVKGLPASVRRAHPSEVSLILDHCYLGLFVGKTAIKVSVTFGQVWCDLTIPLEAVLRIYDPKVRYVFYRPPPAAALRKPQCRQRTPPSGTNGNVVLLSDFRS